MNQLTDLPTINSLRPKILKVEPTESGLVFVTTEGWFYVKIDKAWESCDDSVAISQNELKDIFSVRQAEQLGLLSEVEKDNWVTENEKNYKNSLNEIELTERKLYRELKEKYDSD